MPAVDLAFVHDDAGELVYQRIGGGIDVVRCVAWGCVFERRGGGGAISGCVGIEVEGEGEGDASFELGGGGFGVLEALGGLVTVKEDGQVRGREDAP